jgi:hypothetical protein
MKKILLLFVLLPSLAWGQHTIKISKPSGTGGSMTYPGAGIPLSNGVAWGTSITNNSANWNTAYTDRLKWDGGATGLVAATGRTSLGATTVGAAFFMLTNPSAITFPRINADNTLSALSAANFKTALSLGNVTNESKATMFTSPTFTGTPVIPTPFTLGATSVTSNGTELNVLDGIPGTLTATELGYMDGVTSSVQTQLGGMANKALGNLASVAINTDLLPASNDGAGIGNTSYKFSDVFLASGAVINLNSGDVTLTHSSNLLTIGGGGLSIGGGYDIAMTGSIGATGSRLTKIWTADLEITNSPTVNGTSIASIYAPIASPNFTGTPKLATNDTLATKAYARSVGGGSLDDTIALEKIVTLQGDTVPLFVFLFGGGLIADTAVFNDNAIAGCFFNKGSDTLIITELRGVLAEGTGTETVSVQISWHATFKSGSATDLNGSALAITSTTTGTVDASFAANTIPPNVFVWCKISGVSAGNRPSFLSVTLSGHKKNRAY